MSDQQRDYEDYRRGGRRYWNERSNDERRAAFGDEDPRFRRPYEERDERSWGGTDRRYGIDRRRSSEPWQQGEGYSFGGQRPYARDLYSDSGRSRHETDWTSGTAGREMRGVYSRPSNAGRSFDSASGRNEGESGMSGPRHGFAGRGPKDYQRSDERIREEISDRMTDDYSLDASDLTVHVKQGEVTLSGTVHSRAQKRRAEDLAECSSGVREVTNNIRVAPEQDGIDLNQSPSIRVS